jgi:class 3 adenylate cyclase
MNKVANMQLDNIDTNRKPSIFSEIGRMQMSFYSMVNSIIMYRAFLPDNVLLSTESPVQSIGRPTVSMGVISPRKTKIVPKNGSDTHSDVSRVDRNKFHVGFSFQHVTLLLVKIRNFDELFSELGDPGVVYNLSILFEEIGAIVSRTKGSRSTFSADEFVASYNAVIACSHQCHQAIRAAEQIMKYVQVFNQKKQIPPVSLVISIATEDSYCGNMGTSKMKQYQIVGTIMRRIKWIYQIGKMLNVPPESNILLDDQTRENLSEGVITKPIDIVEVFTTPTNSSVFALHSFIRRKESSSDQEWMYALENQQKQQSDSYFQRAFDSYISGGVSEAIRMMELYLYDHKDPLAEQFLGRILQTKKAEPRPIKVFFSEVA